MNILLNSTKKIVTNRSSEWDRWWKWIWLIAFISGLAFRARHVDEIREAYLSLEVIHRPITALLVGLALLPYILKRPLILFRGIIGLLTIFGLWRLMSTFWSIEPLWTFYRSLEFLIMVALTAVTTWSLHNIIDLQKWMNQVWLWYGFLLISIWISAIMFPEKAFLPCPGIIPYLLVGVIPHMDANGVATFGAILGVVSFTRWLITGKRIWILPMIVAFITMIIAQGRSAIGGAALGILVVLVLLRRFNLLLIIISLVVIFTIFSDFDKIVQEYYMRGQDEVLFWAFSGRKFWWQFAWENYIKENLWLGYGAFAGSRFGVLIDLKRGTTSSLLSSWIETTVDIGILGTIFLAIILITIWFFCVKIALIGSLRESVLAIEFSGVLAILTIRSFFTIEIINHSSWAFLLITGGISWLTISYKGKNKSVLS